MQAYKKPNNHKIPQKFNLDEEGLLSSLHCRLSGTEQIVQAESFARIMDELNEHFLRDPTDSPRKTHAIRI